MEQSSTIAPFRLVIDLLIEQIHALQTCQRKPFKASLIYHLVHVESVRPGSVTAPLLANSRSRWKRLAPLFRVRRLTRGSGRASLTRCPWGIRSRSVAQISTTCVSFEITSLRALMFVCRSVVRSVSWSVGHNFLVLI